MTEVEKIKLFAKFYKIFSAGDYNKAIEILSQIIAKYPYEAAAYHNRGLTYTIFEKYDEAIKDFNQAIKINPVSAGSYVNRGVTYDNMGKYEKAINDYNQALKINPKYVDAYYNRGNVYHKLSKYDDAIIDYNQALKINPEFAEAYNNRGYTYDKLGRYEDAIKDYNEAININPKYAAAYNNRGLTYDKLGKYDKAIIDFNHAIKLDPEDADAYYNRGLAYGNKGDKNKAFKDFATSFSNDKKEKNKNFLGTRFYRFVNYNKDVLQALLNDKFYLSKLDNFNDPFDGIIKKDLINFQTDFLKYFYISCLTKSSDKTNKNDDNKDTDPGNILMWSHYANSHKGICLAYQFTERFFKKYNAYIDKIEYMNNIEYDDRNVFWKSVFFHKYKNWSYEEEYRLIMLNKDTNQPNLINCENFIELKGIYLGYKCPDQDKETLKKLAHEKSIKIYETSLEDKNLYKLIFSEIK